LIRHEADIDLHQWGPYRAATEAFRHRKEERWLLKQILKEHEENMAESDQHGTNSVSAASTSASSNSASVSDNISSSVTLTPTEASYQSLLERWSSPFFPPLSDLSQWYATPTTTTLPPTLPTAAAASPSSTTDTGNGTDSASASSYSYRHLLRSLLSLGSIFGHWRGSEHAIGSYLSVHWDQDLRCIVGRDRCLPCTEMSRMWDEMEREIFRIRLTPDGRVEATFSKRGRMHVVADEEDENDDNDHDEQHEGENLQPTGQAGASAAPPAGSAEHAALSRPSDRILLRVQSVRGGRQLWVAPVEPSTQPAPDMSLLQLLPTFAQRNFRQHAFFETPGINIFHRIPMPVHEILRPTIERLLVKADEKNCDRIWRTIERPHSVFFLPPHPLPHPGLCWARYGGHGPELIYLSYVTAATQQQVQHLLEPDEEMNVGMMHAAAVAAAAAAPPAEGHDAEEEEGGGMEDVEDEEGEEGDWHPEEQEEQETDEDDATLDNVEDYHRLSEDGDDEDLHASASAPAPAPSQTEGQHIPSHDDDTQQQMTSTSMAMPSSMPSTTSSIAIHEYSSHRVKATSLPPPQYIIIAGCKVLGDANVPSGKLSFQLLMTAQEWRERMERQHEEMMTKVMHERAKHSQEEEVQPLDAAASTSSPSPPQAVAVPSASVSAPSEPTAADTGAAAEPEPPTGHPQPPPQHHHPHPDEPWADPNAPAGDDVLMVVKGKGLVAMVGHVSPQLLNVSCELYDNSHFRLDFLGRKMAFQPYRCSCPIEKQLHIHQQSQEQTSQTP